MYYYAYINESSICTGTYGFPSQITDASYIYLGTEDDTSVIGKKWTGTEWVEVVNYYYAQLNEKDIVIAVVELPAETTDTSFIRINSLDESLKGKWYNRTTLQFEVAPVHILADHSTDVVNYRNSDTWLSDKIDEKANTADVYTKTQADAKFALAGTAGTAGLSAYQIAVNNGFVGTEAEWIASLKGDTGDTGANGLSAYQVAVNNGYEGTEAQWLASLHGSDATVTADDVLTKIKTVDGSGSGLDADTLDGSHASDFATATHTHSDYATQNDLNGKADVGHTHATYALADHTHSGYANSSHTHAISDITNLQSTLNGKASSSHTHSEYASASHTHSGYASTSHTHSDYLSTSGGTISGDVRVNGVVRVQGQQALFNSGSMITLSTNNLQTMIAGSSIYSKVAISVSSDERLKRDISDVSVNDAVNFIKSLNVVNYRYKNNDDKHMGVIAQQVIEANPDLAKLFVKQGEDGYLSVNISELVFPLILAVQEILKRLS